MHAQGNEEEYVRRAIGAGFSVLGFSDHTPWPYTSGFVSDMRMKIADYAITGSVEEVIPKMIKYYKQNSK